MDGRPLYDTPVDQRLYVVPEQWNLIHRAVDRRNNILLSAPRGWGKTSLLRQLQLALRTQEEPVSFVDAASVDSGHELLVRTRLALTGSAPLTQRIREQAQLVSTAVAGGAEAPPPGASAALMSELKALEAVPSTTILVDASHSATAIHSVFGRLRDLMWQLPHRWVIAVDDDDAATVLRPPADAFFDTVVRLEPWPVERLMQILSRRLEEEGDELRPTEIQDIAAASAGNPRTALRAANAALVTGRPPVESLDERAQLLAQAAGLGRPHGMLMSELLDLGQASPSDDSLLSRLGLSRGRVSVLLRELLDQGLVVPATDTSKGGAGRPRTIYRPRLDRDP